MTNSLNQNPDHHLVWTLRAALKKAVRSFFEQQKYLEVDTPVLVTSPGTEAHLDYFATKWQDHSGQDYDLWLRSSPELHMKQVLAQGPERIFQFATSFRNRGELSPWHHPEFCMLEWYHADISYHDYIHQTQELIHWCFQRIKDEFPDLKLSDFPGDFQKLTVTQAFRQFAGVDLQDLDPDLAQKSKKAGVISINGSEDFETAFFKILLEKVEPALETMGAVVLCQYPPSQAALSVVEGGEACRFEFYWNGVELCNGFKELVCPQANRKRIREANTIREQEGRNVPQEDHDFYLALESGIPECCGNALGLDRLLALILGRKNIASVLPLRNTWPWKEYSEESGALQV